MKVYCKQTCIPEELSIIENGQELIGELIDWRLFEYCKRFDKWWANWNVIADYKKLIELRK